MVNSGEKLNNGLYNKGTLNERLVLNGKLNRFEKAIKNKNKNKKELFSILESIGLENSDIDFLIENTKLEKKSLIKRILGI